MNEPIPRLITKSNIWMRAGDSTVSIRARPHGPRTLIDLENLTLVIPEEDFHDEAIEYTKAWMRTIGFEDSDAGSIGVESLDEPPSYEYTLLRDSPSGRGRLAISAQGEILGDVDLFLGFSEDSDEESLDAVLDLVDWVCSREPIIDPERTSAEANRQYREQFQQAAQRRKAKKASATPSTSQEVLDFMFPGEYISKRAARRYEELEAVLMNIYGENDEAVPPAS